jgi:hypothetical protein
VALIAGHRVCLLRYEVAELITEHVPLFAERRCGISWHIVPQHIDQSFGLNARDRVDGEQQQQFWVADLK